MESPLTEYSNSNSKNSNFFNYVFNFDEDNKNMIINMLQYTILSIFPLLLVLKLTRLYVPEVEENKKSLEILTESLLQIVFIIMSFWFIHKIVCYIPTYTGKIYKEFNEITIIIPFIFLLLTMQTKLGDKIKILMDRIMDLWSGDATLNNEEYKGNSNIKVKQPILNQDSVSNYLGMNSQGSMPPPPPQMTNMKANTTESQIPAQQQQYPNFNQMHQGQQNTPSTNNPFSTNEPMASNDGGGYGSSFSAF